MIGYGEQSVWLAAGIRTSDHAAFAQFPRAREDGGDVNLLNVHPTDHYEIRPEDIRIEKFVKSSID
jgi:hypothetical protein